MKNMPASRYTDNHVFEQEQRTLFRQNWQLFCQAAQLKDNGDYDVNYDSCILTTPMFGGVVDEELNLVNQHDSVLGVVWFQDPNVPPQYQEFQFD